MTQPNSPKTPTSLRLLIPPLLAALALAGLVWGLGTVSPARAGGTIRYVDGAGGSDTGDCSNSASPCQTIQYAINQSPAGDEIRVAQGTYTETIGVGVTLTLKGGYEASGWTRDIAANSTLIDANGADSSVVNISPGSSVTIEGFTVQGANHTSDAGGGFVINDATVVISATTIQNNHTNNQAGGIWYEGGGVNISLINSSLLNNSASGDGGAVGGCCTGGTGSLALQNTLVQGNSASGEGGGFRLSGVSLFITASQIISNTASGCCGGGIRAEFAPVTITNSSILSNTTNGGGGGIFADNNNPLVLDNVNISGNQAAGSGGGLALFQATAVITGGQIVANTAWTGGGLWQESASTTLNGVVVQGNLANGSAYAAGGGVDTSNSSLTLNDSIIENNVVQSTGGGENLGGAINNNSGSVELMNTIIRNNNSQGTPVVQIYQAALTVTNALVADNQGPGFAGTPTQGSFTNVTIANNNGFGLGIGPLETGSEPPINVTIANSIFWGNGGGDYFCDTSVGTVNCSLSYSDVGVGDSTGTGNISADPLFVNPASGDYHLKVGSPARDTGTPNGAPAADMEGTLRQGAPDMGALEWVGTRVSLPIIIR